MFCNFQTLVTFYLEVESKGRQLLRSIPVVVHLKQNQNHLKLQRAKEKMNQNQHLLGEGILRYFCLEPLVKFCIAKVSKRYQNCNGGVMVSMLAVSAVNHGFQPGRVKPKTTNFTQTSFVRLFSLRVHQHRLHMHELLKRTV